MEQALAILQQKRQKAVELARPTVKQEKVKWELLKESLCYFDEDWNDLLHPTRA